MPGKKYASIKNPKQYEDLKQRGFNKQSAARISNASYAKGHPKKGGKHATK